MNSGCIETFSGMMIDPLAPEAGLISIDDIAHSLSMQCRFNGHSTRFYSVAEHSVHAAKLAEKFFPDKPIIAKFALLHDASEAYLCDVPRPIKSSFPNYLEWESALSEIIYKKYTGKLPTEADEAMILKVDNIMLATESRELIPSKGKDWGVPECVDSETTLFCWSPEEAENEFYKIFKRYSE